MTMATVDPSPQTQDAPGERQEPVAAGRPSLDARFQSPHLEPPATTQGSRRRSILRWLRADPIATLGLVLVGLLVLTAAAAPWLAPFPPNAQPALRLQPPGATYWLGTDEFGRDVLSRIIFGARVSLQVGVIAVSIALLLGGAVGLISGFYGGLADSLIQRVVDVMLAFPSVILIIAISGVTGPGMATAMVAIGLVYAPIFARVARGPTLSIVNELYVESARAIGAGTARIITHHVLPNVMAPLIIQSTLAFSTAILSEATLSFLGLGVQPPDPSWGTMLGSGRNFMELAPWVAIFPGVAIMLAVLGFNLLGDGLRDMLDPRLRAR
jgi:peptide/nickel transport system permease protein